MHAAVGTNGKKEGQTKERDKTEIKTKEKSQTKGQTKERDKKKIEKKEKAGHEKKDIAEA